MSGRKRKNSGVRRAETSLPATPRIIGASTSWNGPLPHPMALAQFGQIDPAFPRRIVEMAESAHAHAQSIENQAMAQHATDQARNESLTRRGQTFGFVIAVMGLMLVGFGFYTGHPVAATTFGAVELAALVGVFVYGQGRSGSGQE